MAIPVEILMVIGVILLPFLIIMLVGLGYITTGLFSLIPCPCDNSLQIMPNITTGRQINAVKMAIYLLLIVLRLSIFMIVLLNLKKKDNF